MGISNFLVVQLLLLLIMVKSFELIAPIQFHSLEKLQLVHQVLNHLLCILNERHIGLLFLNEGLHAGE